MMQLYVYLLVAFVCCTCTMRILLAMESNLLQRRQTVPSIFVIFEFLFGTFLKESEWSLESRVKFGKNFQRSLPYGTAEC